jgi:hypothetical protein
MDLSEVLLKEAINKPVFGGFMNILETIKDHFDSALQRSETSCRIYLSIMIKHHRFYFHYLANKTIIMSCN